jgi:WD40 repeat protein
VSGSSYYQTITYLPDGNLLIVDGNVARILDGLTGKEKVVTGRDSDDIYFFISVSPSGHLLTFGHESSVAVWDILENKQVANLSLPDSHNSFCSICFSADGRFIATGSSGGTVQIWQRSTWLCLTTLYGHLGSVSSVTFQHNGRRILSASHEDHTIRIWDVSAVVEGKEFQIDVDEGALVVPGWFRHGIPLGGWMDGDPFVSEHPFKLPAGVDPLDWKEESGAVQPDKASIPTEEV